MDAAQAMAIPADQRILHVLPQEFVIDNQEGVREPLGMSGVRLEAKVHMVTCALNAAQNIEKCVERCGLAVNDIVLEQLASSYSVLTQDERDNQGIGNKLIRLSVGIESYKDLFNDLDQAIKNS